MKLRPWSSSSLGFTLVELLVVVAIFIALTSIVLFNQNRFSSNISIQNMAYQIALAVRQAQVYGLSVRGSGPGSFDTAYGLHFDSSTSTKFIFYADNNKDNKYATSDDTKISDFYLDSGTILDICTYDSATDCFSSVGATNIISADITFNRPHPEAIIGDSLSQVGDPRKARVEVTVQSIIKDRTQKIIVTQPGQIYVSN